jgi:hypothetical protein
VQLTSPPRLVAITVHLPAEWDMNLEALVDPASGLDDVAAVLVKLADHAQQGVHRPGAWERDWLHQAFGYGWHARLEPEDEIRDV